MQYAWPPDPPGFSSEVGMDAGTEMVLKESMVCLCSCGCYWRICSSFCALFIHFSIVHRSKLVWNLRWWIKFNTIEYTETTTSGRWAEVYSMIRHPLSAQCSAGGCRSTTSIFGRARHFLAENLFVGEDKKNLITIR